MSDQHEQGDRAHELAFCATCGGTIERHIVTGWSQGWYHANTIGPFVTDAVHKRPQHVASDRFALAVRA